MMEWGVEKLFRRESVRPPEKRELVELLDTEERWFEEDVRDKTAGFLSRIRESRATPWVNKGLAMARLFTLETSLAALASDQQLPPPETPMEVRLEETDLSEYQLMGETSEIIREIVNSGGSITVYASPEDKGLRDDLGTIIKKREAMDTLASLRPFESLRPIQLTEIEMSFPKDEFPTEGEGWTLETTHVAGTDIWTASKEYTDKDNNVIRVFSILSSDSDTGTRSVTVTSGLAFENDDPEERFRALDIDLTQAGLGILDNVYYQPVVEKIGSMGAYAVFSQDIYSHQLDIIKETYEDDIVAGIDQAYAMFGITPDLRGVHIVDATDQNAAYYVPNPDIIHLNDALFKKTGTKKPLSESNITQVVFHEMVHKLDDGVLGLHNHPEWVAIYDSFSAPQFSELDEQMFLAGYGGHSKANAREFTASFINSLTHEQWEQKIQSVSPGLQEKYLAGLVVLQNIFDTNTNVPLDAPIVEILEERITFLQSPLLQSVENPDKPAKK